MTRIGDTSAEVENRVREILRVMPFHRKWQQMGAIYHTGKVLFAMGFRLRRPEATDEEIQSAWLTTSLESNISLPSGRFDVSSTNDNLRVLKEVIDAFTSLTIPYALGGSWASSILGKMRFTLDADLSVEPFPGRELDLCGRFNEDYYISFEAVRDAVQRRSSFNIVDTITGFKVDVFVRKDRPFEVSAMARRRPYPLPGTPEQSIVCVTSEDIILFKLEWYRLGGESSGQQWTDVLGVLDTQSDRLDQTYLDHWATDLGVSDLLSRAQQEICS